MSAAAASPAAACPGCGRPPAGPPFYEVGGVPTVELRLVTERDAALACQRGDVRLAFCGGCGLVWNLAFDPALIRYDEDYESTQTASPTFNRFHEALAREVIERYGLRGREVVEIGCGQGEFLGLLCRLGGNRGLGFDPVFRGGGGRLPPGATVVKAPYTERQADLRPDLLLCKMTLEHIPDTRRFLAMVRRALGDDRRDTGVLFMVPEFNRVLDERAFWDVSYEHCTYFSPGTLARTFRGAGFNPLELWTAYGGQYLLIDARPGGGRRPGAGEGGPLPGEEPLADLAARVAGFAEGARADRDRWVSWLEARRAAGRRVVFWGGGAKTVAFLATLGASAGAIESVVDINPRKRNTYLPGTGHRVVTPDFLPGNPPDAVILANPIYRREVGADLAAMGLAPELVPIAPPPGRAPTSPP